jgi:hypothetical protein
MKLLLLISLLLAVETTYARNLQAMQGETFFNAEINIAEHTATGIVVIKEIDADTYRILFTTLAGPKLMDMYITRDGYKILYVAKMLKRRIILRALQRDFALVAGLYLVTEKHCDDVECSIKLSKNTSAHYSFDANDRIGKAEYRRKQKPVSTVEYTYRQDSIASIVLRRCNFNMNIRLNSIHPTCQN